MREELPSDDLRTVWQNQPTGTYTMTTKLIRSKARELHAKTRRQLLGSVAGPLAAAFFYAFGIREFPTPQHVLHPLFAFALVWSLVGLYFLSQGLWSAVLPGDAGLSTGLEFCRGEIERRRHLLRRVLLWSFGPVLLAIGTFISTLTRNQIIAGAATFGVCLLLWVLEWVSGYETATWAKVLAYCSVITHFDSFAKGVLDTKDAVFYLSVIFLGLFLTSRSLESLRWRS